MDIHPDWDPEKAAAHLADLDAKAATEHAVFDALTEAAEEHLRTAHSYENQAAYCRARFTQPKEQK